MDPATILTIAMIAGAMIFFASGYLYGRSTPAWMLEEGDEEIYESTFPAFSSDASLEEMLGAALRHSGAKSVHIFDRDGLEIAGTGQGTQNEALGAQVGLALSLLRSENRVHESASGDRPIQLGAVKLRALGPQSEGEPKPGALWLATVEGTQELDTQHRDQIFRSFKRALFQDCQAA